MTKSHYLGGSSVVGFSGLVSGEQNTRMGSKADLDARLKQIMSRNKARTAAANHTKKPAASSKSSPESKGRADPNRINIRSKSRGLTIPKQIIKAETRVNLKIEEVEAATQMLQKLERELVISRGALVNAVNLPRRSAIGQALLEAQKVSDKT